MVFVAEKDFSGHQARALHKQDPNDTYALTGLPGRVKIGGPARARSVPKPCGIPGCIATLRNADRAQPLQGRLDHVVLAAHADAAAGDQQIGRGQLALEAASTRRGRRAPCVAGAGQPARRAAAASMTLFDSQIWPGITAMPGSTNSLPVEITVTRGRGRASAVP